jgi:hypothetical protein
VVPHVLGQDDSGGCCRREPLAHGTWCWAPCWPFSGSACRAGEHHPRISAGRVQSSSDCIGSLPSVQTPCIVLGASAELPPCQLTLGTCTTLGGSRDTITLLQICSCCLALRFSKGVCLEVCYTLCCTGGNGRQG